MLNPENRFRFCVLVSSLFATAALVLSTAGGAQDEPKEQAAAESETVDTTDYTKLKSPFPYTEKSIRRGKMLFIRYCAECHGPDGKAQIDVIADSTDLTAPKTWLSGTSEGQIFRSIRDGAGVSMPPFSFKIRREEDMWHLMNFTRSLWPKSMRPQLQEEAALPETTTKSEEPSENGGRGRE